MTARELRIGNLLQGNEVVTVTKILGEDRVGISSGDPYIVSGSNPCLSPIPITEEWLLKFGFERSGLLRKDFVLYLPDDEDNLERLVISYHSAEPTLMTFGICDTYELESPIWKPIKYIHQLQNLYYYLTAKELEIK